MWRWRDWGKTKPEQNRYWLHNQDIIDTVIEPQNRGATLFLLSKTDTVTAEKTPRKESEGSDESPEEEESDETKL